MGVMVMTAAWIIPAGWATATRIACMVATRGSVPGTTVPGPAGGTTTLPSPCPPGGETTPGLRCRPGSHPAGGETTHGIHHGGPSGRREICPVPLGSLGHPCPGLAPGRTTTHRSPHGGTTTHGRPGRPGPAGRPGLVGRLPPGPAGRPPRPPLHPEFL